MDTECIQSSESNAKGVRRAGFSGLRVRWPIAVLYALILGSLACAMVPQGGLWLHASVMCAIGALVMLPVCIFRRLF